MKTSRGKKKPDAPDLADLVHLGVKIQNLNQTLERRYGLSLVQWSVLRSLIDMPATSARKLAGIVQIHPSTLTQSLGRLQRKGYLFASTDPRDARKKMLVATREGKDAVDVLTLELCKLERDKTLGAAMGVIDGFLADCLRATS